MWEERVANARIEIECSRLLTLKAAHPMDTVGNKVARAEIAMIKVKAPLMALGIIDDAIQAHGGAGVTTDFGLARSYASMRTLRLADGPDEVHRRNHRATRVSQAHGVARPDVVTPRDAHPTPSATVSEARRRRRHKL